MRAARQLHFLPLLRSRTPHPHTHARPGLPQRCYNSCACGRGGTTLVIQQQPPQAYQQQQQQQRQVIVQQAPQVVYKQSPPKVVYQAPPQPQAQPQQQYPPHPAGPPPELHAFYGAAADVTARVAQLVTYSILAEDATFAAAEDPCPALSKGLCVVYDAGAGALAVAGCAQGASLQLPPGARVKLALWGAFADVSDRVLGHARAPAFAVLASASFLQVADPAPGAQKFLLVHVLGAAGGGTVVRADDGQKLAVRWA